MDTLFRFFLLFTIRSIYITVKEKGNKYKLNVIIALRFSSIYPEKPDNLCKMFGYQLVGSKNLFSSDNSPGWTGRLPFPSQPQKIH
jgi:hypothetical protein